jgi:anion-transporting  ArsA/GET3 family ATPase
MSDKKNDNKPESSDAETIKDALNDLKTVFSEFKESSKEMLVKTGSIGGNNPEDLSDEDLEKLASSLKDLEQNIKNIKF